VNWFRNKAGDMEFSRSFINNGFNAGLEYEIEKVFRVLQVLIFLNSPCLLGLLIFGSLFREQLVRQGFLFFEFGLSLD